MNLAVPHDIGKLPADLSTISVLVLCLFDGVWSCEISMRARAFFCGRADVGSAINANSNRWNILVTRLISIFVSIGNLEGFAR
jgi:hypothetical protein